MSGGFFIENITISGSFQASPADSPTRFVIENALSTVVFLVNTTKPAVSIVADLNQTGNSTFNSNILSVYNPTTSSLAFQVDSGSSQVYLPMTAPIPSTSSFASSGLQFYLTYAASATIQSMSNDGRYQASLGIATRAQISTNYGFSPTPIPNAAYYANGIVTRSGQTMFFQSGGVGSSTLYNQAIVSHNYGSTWTQTSYNFDTPNGSYYTLKAVISDDGNTIISIGFIDDGINLAFGTQQIISIDGGLNWSLYQSSAAVDKNSGISPTVGMSGSGQYRYYNDVDGNCFVSSNYGVSYAAIGTPTLVNGVTCDQSGKYVYLFTSTNAIYLSSNYGQSFVNVSSSPSGTINTIRCSNTGQFVTLRTSPGFSYSRNYGSTWTVVSGYSGGVISGIGNFIMASSNAQSNNFYTLNTADVVNSSIIPLQTNVFNIGATSATFANGYFGTAVYANGVQLTSDARLKQNIEMLPRMSEIDLLQPVKYEFISQPGRIRYGFIAQEVQKIMPELVEDGEKLSLNMIDMIAILWKEVQELRKERA